MSKNQLEDRDTREFIYDFIIKHGGREAAVQEVKQRPAPPSPVSGPPVPPRVSLFKNIVFNGTEKISYFEKKL